MTQSTFRSVSRSAPPKLASSANRDRNAVELRSHTECAPPYCASKAAEKSISEGLKIDLMGTPVRVTSVDAGMVETNFSTVRFRGDEERAAKVYQNITPLQPEDVADAIVWAASRPAHVNIHTVVMTTIDQANSTVFHRRG